MAGIIDDLYDLSHARRGDGIPVVKVETCALTVIKRVVAEHEALCREAVISVNAVGDSTGLWDAGRLGQVFSNLIGNAVRHGARERPIDVTVDGTGDELVCSVHNEGSIPPELVPELFDPFRSGRETSGRREGLGLGLFIVDQIVQAHGGSVEVASTEASGTTFVVRLPKVPARESRPSTPARGNV